MYQYFNSSFLQKHVEVISRFTSWRTTTGICSWRKVGNLGQRRTTTGICSWRKVGNLGQRKTHFWSIESFLSKNLIKFKTGIGKPMVLLSKI